MKETRRLTRHCTRRPRVLRDVLRDSAVIADIGCRRPAVVPSHRSRVPPLASRISRGTTLLTRTYDPLGWVLKHKKLPDTLGEPTA
jgi:hypothetical protein